MLQRSERLQYDWVSKLSLPHPAESRLDCRHATAGYALRSLAGLSSNKFNPEGSTIHVEDVSDLRNALDARSRLRLLRRAIEGVHVLRSALVAPTGFDTRAKIRIDR